MLRKSYPLEAKRFPVAFERLVTDEIGPRGTVFIRELMSRASAGRTLITVEDVRRREELRSRQAAATAPDPDQSWEVNNLINGIPDGFYRPDVWLLHVDEHLNLLGKCRLEEVGFIEDLYYASDAKTLVLLTETREYGTALRRKAIHEHEEQRARDEGLEAWWRRGRLGYQCAVCGRSIEVGELSWAVRLAAPYTSITFKREAANGGNLVIPKRVVTKGGELADTEAAKDLMRRGNITREQIEALHGDVRVCGSCQAPPEAAAEERREKEKGEIERAFRATSRYQALVFDEQLHQVAVIRSTGYSDPIPQAIHVTSDEAFVAVQVGSAPAFRLACLTRFGAIVWQLDWHWDGKQGGIYELTGPKNPHVWHTREKGPRAVSVKENCLELDSGFRINISTGEVET